MSLFFVEQGALMIVASKDRAFPQHHFFAS